MKIKLGKKIISNNSKTYFIADIAANHDGKISRAKKLIRLCAKAGANAAKFQHFKAETIVSDAGFRSLGKIAHQKKWKKSVFEIYKEASINPSWSVILKKECRKNRIDYMTAPYDLNYVDEVKKDIVAYKIGSGDITWKKIIKKISKKKKPVLLATGASNFQDVKRAVKEILKFNKKIVIMQCNTNYTADKKNFNYINLNVLKTFKKKFPQAILGLSDHTLGHETVLGAITLGARVIEKHFTDNNNRTGPDHKFSMSPKTWRQMIDASRNIELSLGSSIKKIEKNETQTSIIQRRSLRYKKELEKGKRVFKKDTIPLRPAPKDSIGLNNFHKVSGKKLKKNVKFHEHIKFSDFE